jgi:hypothetical protein
LAERERATDGRPKQSNGTTVKPTLTDLVISRDQSSRWQKLASVPSDQNEASDKKNRGARCRSFYSIAGGAGASGLGESTPKIWLHIGYKNLEK